jgi:hypothetical protein
MAQGKAEPLPDVVLDDAVLHAGELTLTPYAPLKLALKQAHEGAAYGVFASDRPKLNLLATPRLALSPFQRLEVRTDGRVTRRLPVRWQGAWPKDTASGDVWFVVWLNGKLTAVPAGGTLTAVAGDQLVLEGVLGSREEVLNLKGFVPDAASNSGQDAGLEIILEPSMFIPRYLKPTETPGEWMCKVVRETTGKTRDGFRIRVAPRLLAALRLRTPAGLPLTLNWSPKALTALPPGSYTLEDALGNGPREKILLTIAGKPLPWGSCLTVAPNQVLTLTARQATTFKPLGDMELAPNLSASWSNLGSAAGTSLAPTAF